jgi:hypothetical protein
MQRFKIDQELLQDIQTSMQQLAAGAGIDHKDARSAVLKRVALLAEPTKAPQAPVDPIAHF